MEKIFKVLADKNRLRILFMLSCRKMCVCELAFVIGIRQPSVSRHLKKLKAAGLIDDEQEGYWTNYCLAKGADHKIQVLIRGLLSWMKDDAVHKKDLQKMKKADRKKLCRG